MNNRRRQKNDAFDPEEGLRVAEKRCDECLFTKNKIVSDSRKAEVLTKCRESQTYFICHKSNGGPAVVCRGFFDEAPNRACHMARVLRIVQFVDPATGQKRVALPARSE